MGLNKGFNWSYKSPKWGYPNYNLLITLRTKSHEPLSGARPTRPGGLPTLCGKQQDMGVGAELRTGGAGAVQGEALALVARAQLTRGFFWRS